MSRNSATSHFKKLPKLFFQKNRNASLNGITTTLAILVALGLAIVLIFLVSKDPNKALYHFLLGPLSSKRQLGNILTTATTISFTGVAVCIMFQASMFSMIAEGAFFLGAMAGAVIATTFSLPPFLSIVVPMLAGALIGGIIGFVPGILRAKLKANEMVASLMINYVVLYLGLYLLKNLFIDKTAGQLATTKLPSISRLPILFSGTGIHSGVPVVIVVIFLAYLYLYKTRRGYQLRIYGQNANFAGYVGVNINSVIITSQIIGGSIAGFGGAVEVLGMYQRFQWTALPGYGWDGIIIAILARNKPQFVPLAALFIAYLRTGANNMNTYADVPKELITVIQAIMMILVTAEALNRSMRQKIAVKEALISGTSK